MLLVDGYQALLQPWDIRARREVPECVVLMCPTTFNGQFTLLRHAAA